MLKHIITVAGVAGTLGSAAPAFADWYNPAPPPAYGMPVQSPPYAYGDGDRDDWRWREHEAWRRHEAWERYRRWRRAEWARRHGGWGYYQSW